MTIAALRDRFRDPTAAELQLIARYGELPEDARRARAFEAFAASGLPHRRMEQWKWTDFRQSVSTIEKSGAAHPALLTIPDDAIVLRFDGQRWIVPGTVPDGIRVFEKTEGQALGNAEVLPMAALAAALTGRKSASDVLQVEITEALDMPVFLDFDLGGREAAFVRISFVVRPGARLDVIERHTGGAGLSSVIVDCGVQDRGHATRTLVQSGTSSEATAITSSVTLGAAAQFEQTALAFGAKVARIETRLSHDGPEAHATLNAAYLASAGQHVDFTSHVRHGAESCVTRQLTKGAVSQGGRGVFQGKFHVPRTIGQYTDADMQHQALLLEEGAEVFAKPELEIYADDVECAHGNTSGQLDETALFYMRQRGIPLADARALLTEAFIADALQMAHESVRDDLLAASRGFLRGKA